MNWFGYYLAQTVAIATFAGLTIWGLKRNWEGVVIVFGIALLMVGCNVVKPA